MKTTAKQARFTVPSTGSWAEKRALAPLQRRVLPIKERVGLAAVFQPSLLPQQIP